MIIDVSEIPSGEVLKTEICIVGSGAAGISMAREFMNTPYSVVVLEGGGARFEAASLEPYRSAVVGLPHGGIHVGRARQVGGTTTLWAGQALPLFDIDFEARDWVAQSGWPIERSTLLPYYKRAEDIMQIPRSTYDTESWPRTDGTPPLYDPDLIVAKYSQFTATPNFSDKYKNEIAAATNVRLITHANVVAIEANPTADVIKEVRIRSPDSSEIAVQAKVFIICCGGIETARLLLSSDSVEPHGIGNRYDVVGRYFQDHPAFSVPVVPDDPSRFARLNNSVRRNNRRYAFKLVASPVFQRQKRVLNMGAEVYYPTIADGSIAAAKDVLKILNTPSRYRELVPTLRTVMRDPGPLFGAVYRHYIKHQPASVGSTVPHVGLSLEQEPNAESRVRLGDERDRMGMRRTVLDWRLTGLEAKSTEIFLDAIASEWQRLQIGSVDLAACSALPTAAGGFIDSNHHIGTTRMGTDPRRSVVGPDCRVHGYDNLYIGSSSVFPTGGFSNPTLTVISLCLRMADSIKERLAGGELTILP